jgi:ligand-binding sensor domain-containing protein/signal transduction histidine kinase
MVGATAGAEQLPVHRFTTADGLANNRVDHGARDHRGFLWFATLDGVSRFDGERFTSYGVSDGLPGSETHEVAATRDDVLWVATSDGLAWLDLDERVARPRFDAIATPYQVLSLREDAEGTLWAGTGNGLVRVVRANGKVELEPLALGDGRQPLILAIVCDASDGSLWLGTTWGLVHRARDGAITRFRVGPRSQPDDRVFALAIDRMHRLWIGGVGRAIVAVPLPLAPTDEPLWDAAARGGGLLRFEPTGAVRRKILEDSRGTIWIGTTVNAVKFEHETFTELTTAQMTASDGYAPCVEDAAGNVWFGGAGRGLLRLAHHGLVSYPIDEIGKPLESVGGFVLDRAGTLYLVAAGAAGNLIARREGERFVAVQPKLIVEQGAWGWGQTTLVDRDGRWWYPTSNGVLRYPPIKRFEDLATTTPELFDVASGLPGRDIFRMYEDRRGDVWITTMSRIGLARWDRATNKMITLGEGWPRGVATAFAEDREAMWITYSSGELVRVHDGRPQILDHRDGLPEGTFESLLVDHAERVWIALGHGGVVRIDDPASPNRRIVRYTKREGLTSEQTKTIVEDAAGKIYIGTSRGIDWIDPRTQSIGHYGIEDGLPNDYVHVAIRDRDGTLWFGTRAGAAHLVPDGRPSVVRAPTFITRIVVAGEPRPIAAGGETSAPALELAADERDVVVGFTTPSFVSGEVVRYEYRLDGGAWSEPVPRRDLQFARLAAGDYKLEVRARYPDGTTSVPASLAFVVLPPIWLRSWFIGLCTLLVVTAGYIAYRRKLAHLLAIERVRTRIATDLHDDLGSSLSRIAILSDLASRRIAPDGEAAGPLGDIGRCARELVDVASDIVWSTDPKRDNLGSLMVRLREFAGDVLEARDIVWSLVAPSEPERIALDPDRRRHLYMVIKEAINNAARHAGAGQVTIVITHTDRALEARIHDDGRGFDPEVPRQGNGVANMRARAADIGGTLSITSDDRGTDIMLRVPLRR